MSHINLPYIKERYKRFITEIGKVTNPYATSFRFRSAGPDYITSFRDSDNDTVTVKFEWMGGSKFNIGFDINGDTKQYKVSTTKNLLQIISTVTLVVKQFIEDYDPLRLEIFSDDKKMNVNGRSFDKQKKQIYRAYISNILEPDYHLVSEPSTDSNTIVIEKITEAMKEAGRKRNESTIIWLAQQEARRTNKK